MSLSTNWDNVASITGDVVKYLAPIVEAAVPGSSIAINIGEAILQGAISAEPAAVALYDQITSGTPVTADQLKAYITDNDAANQELQDAIAAARAKLPQS